MCFDVYDDVQSDGGKRRFAHDYGYLFSAFTYVADRELVNASFVACQTSTFRAQAADAHEVTPIEMALAAQYLGEVHKAALAGRSKPSQPANVPDAALTLLRNAQIAQGSRDWSEPKRGKIRSKLMALS